MELSNIISNITSLSNIISSKNKYATELSNHINNKDTRSIRTFVFNLVYISIMVIYLSSHIDKNLISKIVSDQEKSYLITTIIDLIGFIPIAYFFVKISFVNVYYEKEVIKLYREIKSKKRTFFSKTNEKLNKYIASRTGVMFLEIIFPPLVSALCCWVIVASNNIKNDVIVSLILIINSSILIALHSKQYKTNFGVSNTYSKAKFEQVIGYDVVNINGKNYYFSIKRNKVLYQDFDRVIELTKKPSKFSKLTYELFHQYAIDSQNIWKEHLNSEYCKNKKETNDVIKAYYELEKQTEMYLK